MIRPSRVLWVAAAILLVTAGLSLVQGFATSASAIHGTDVDRDAVFGPVIALVDGGAIDLDKAAAVLGAPAYSGTTTAQRAQFEEDVKGRLFFFTTDPAHERALARIDTAGSTACGLGLVTLMSALLVGWQAYRVKDLYE